MAVQHSLFRVLLTLCYGLAVIQGGIVRINDEEKPALTCGYAGCPKTQPDKLNVHLVPHSHDDVGWLKTIDQYFYGSRQEIQIANVQSIIDTVIQSLRKDPQRRFIYVETAYLWKWWNLQDAEVQREVRKFINEGRLEIIGGAWSMNDEATTHYQSIIDQSTWGFRRLNDTFGECARPKIGWQIDSFGHSREQASIFAQFGFDAIFFARLDWEDKAHRLNEKTAEFVWKSSPNLGEKVNLFSVALYNHYSAPSGFCFDILCRNRTLDDQSENGSKYTERKIKDFYSYILRQASHYQTNNIILTMGDDFHYQQAENYFSNMDKLIRYTNELYGKEVNVFYSTPSCYAKSLNEANKTWTTKSDDFFPYSHNERSFWTGYYTSRPTLKYFERLGNNFLQVAKQLKVLSNQTDDEDLQFFREVMGVMQHHDAITGTEKQHVADDYAKFLHEAITRGENITSKSISQLSTQEHPGKQEAFKSCLLLNISACEPTENSTIFILTLYNPQSQPTSTYVRLPVVGKGYSVKDHLGIDVPNQLLPIPGSVSKIPGRNSSASRELVFRAADIPPLGYQSYHISEKVGENVTDEVTPAAEVSSIGRNHNISVHDNGNVIIEWKNQDLRIIQSMNYYDGGKVFFSSGAYLFRPQNSTLHSFSYNGSFRFYKGALVEELHLTINDYVSEVVRVYDQEDKVEVEWMVGPIPVNDDVAKEVVVKYSSNLESKGCFYTDSNGREMLKRVRNSRPTWNISMLLEPVAANYYPVTTKMSLVDEGRKLRLSVLNDRAQGGSSINDGELEVMLHRRLLRDDRLGVGEVLNEEAFGAGLVARGVHHLVGSNLTDLDGAAAKEKSAAKGLAMRPWVFITPVNVTFAEWKNNHRMQFKGLNKNLPRNVHVLTLEPWKEGQVLLRLEHLFEIAEAKDLSKAVEVNLLDLFANLVIKEVRETTLGANQWIEDMHRLKWVIHTNEVHEELEKQNGTLPVVNGTMVVLLRPMEIRTFIISIK
ncbi:lysosomal alpha-mannosidase-like [Diachasmimorpha longicaudata]|uniref:lysosomal alpha-mannosidase-like n=1 Tax=Diachasmimorpha longicaudata TaxID=58733 RepID=UPI0030B87874